MIIGRVTRTPEALVPLTVHGADGQSAHITALLDTGFTDYLTLSPQTIRALHLPQVDVAECELADGRVVSMEGYQASVLWDGALRQILVLSADGGPLLGMALLRGCRIALDVVPGGSVAIEPIADDGS